MKHITEATEAELAQHFANERVGGVALVPGVEDYAQARALRAAFDFTPTLSPERADARRRVDAALAEMSAPQPAEGVAELVDELRKYAEEFNYGDYSQKLVQRTIAALSTPQRPTPSDEERAEVRLALNALSYMADESDDFPSREHPSSVINRVLRKYLAALGKGEAE